MLFHLSFKKEYKEEKACDKRDKEIVKIIIILAHWIWER